MSDEVDELGARVVRAVTLLRRLRARHAVLGLPDALVKEIIDVQALLATATGCELERPLVDYAESVVARAILLSYGKPPRPMN
jgi:hypothetical protein